MRLVTRIYWLSNDVSKQTKKDESFAEGWNRHVQNNSDIVRTIVINCTEKDIKNPNIMVLSMICQGEIQWEVRLSMSDGTSKID